MGTYNKEKDISVTLQNVTKDDLKATAKKDHRSVNSFINRAIDKAIEEVEKEN